MFKIEHNKNYPLERGNGFLLDENDNCIGGYGELQSGEWLASIDIDALQEEGDCIELGRFGSKCESINALISYANDLGYEVATC